MESGQFQTWVHLKAVSHVPYSRSKTKWFLRVGKSRSMEGLLGAYEAWADSKLDTRSLFSWGKENRVLFHCVHKKKMLTWGHTKGTRRNENAGLRISALRQPGGLCVSRLLSSSCIFICARRSTSSLWQLDKQPWSWANDAQISKNFCGTAEAGRRDWSDMILLSWSRGKLPWRNVQIFVGWEDKPLKSPRPVASLLIGQCSQFEGRILVKILARRWVFLFEQQNENLRVGSGFKIHSLLCSSITHAIIYPPFHLL